jgi:hypothetical protein
MTPRVVFARRPVGDLGIPAVVLAVQILGQGFAKNNIRGLIAGRSQAAEPVGKGIIDFEIRWHIRAPRYSVTFSAL